MRILGLLITAGLILVILGVALSIGSKIVEEVRDDASTIVTTINNETVTIVNENTTANFAYANAGAYFDWGNYSDVSVTNATAESDEIGTKEYAINSEGILMGVFAAEEGTWNGLTVNVTYTYTKGDVAWDAAQSSGIGIANLSSWEDTIATVIAAVVIIGLLMAGFGGFLAIRGGRV